MQGDDSRMKISLSGNMETALIPLYGRAKMSRDGLFEDKDAERAITLIDYDFTKLRVQYKTQVMMAVRAKLIDGFTKEYLRDSPECTAIYLGCGLDARASRLRFPAKMWYDLDYGGIIEIKRQLYEQTNRYKYISSSVNDWAWMDGIEHRASVLVIAEGLLMYLNEQDVRELLLRLRDTFGCATIIFDAFSLFTARRMKRHPSLKSVYAVIRWGCESPKDIEAFGGGIRHRKTLYLTDSAATGFLPQHYRLMFSLAGLFKAAREAHRVFVFDLTTL